MKIRLLKDIGDSPSGDVVEVSIVRQVQFVDAAGYMWTASNWGGTSIDQFEVVDDETPEDLIRGGVVRDSDVKWPIKAHELSLGELLDELKRRL